MSEQKIAITEDELHAYVDNELPAERRGDVEAWLAETDLPHLGFLLDGREYVLRAKADTPAGRPV